MCKTPFKQFCYGPTDQPTDGPTEKWLIESRSTRLKSQRKRDRQIDKDGGCVRVCVHTCVCMCKRAQSNQSKIAFFIYGHFLYFGWFLTTLLSVFGDVGRPAAFIILLVNSICCQQAQLSPGTFQCSNGLQLTQCFIFGKNAKNTKK